MELVSPHMLRAWLDHRGLSYADLAQCAGVSKQFIGQLATGKRKTCKPETAARIEQVLLPRPDLRGPNEMPLFRERTAPVARQRRARKTSKTVGGTSDTVGVTGK